MIYFWKIHGISSIHLKIFISENVFKYITTTFLWKISFLFKKDIRILEFPLQRLQSKRILQAFFIKSSSA